MSAISEGNGILISLTLEIAFSRGRPVGKRVSEGKCFEIEANYMPEYSCKSFDHSSSAIIGRR